MAMQYLLERLDSDPGSDGVARSPFDLKAAVRAQIERLMSSRLPAGPDDPLAPPRFGMPSVVELCANDKGQVEAYAARLVRLLSRYEPRLLRPAVDVIEGSTPLTPFALRIRGTLDQHDDVLEVSFPLG
jgi:predicted component of type VI protein secretion system